MALDAVLQNLDSIDDSLKAHYTEVPNVGYVLQANPFVNDSVSYGLINDAGYKTTLKTLRAEVKAATDGNVGMEAYVALGTVAEIGAKLTAAGEAGTKTEAQITQIRTDYEFKLAEQTKLNKDAFDQLNQSNHSREITSLLSINKADIVDGAGAQGYFDNVMRGLTAVNDKGVVFVSDVNGNEVMSKIAGSGANMTVGELWDIVKADPAHAFALKPSGAAGSGSSGSSGGGTPAGGIATDGKGWNAMDKAAQIAYYRTNAGDARRLASLGAQVV